MLFQGSKKYPKATEYFDFVSDHGGSSNAFTGLNETNFHFSSSNDAFEEGVDRLAQFFIDPCFSIDSTEKEVKAVDSEYRISL